MQTIDGVRGIEVEGGVEGLNNIAASTQVENSSGLHLIYSQIL